MKTTKTAAYSLLITAIVIGIIALALDYGSVVPRKGIGDLKVTPILETEQAITLKVSGTIIDSSPGIGITHISQQRNGDCIVLLVRKGFRLGGRSMAKFSIDISVPGGVDSVAFGTPQDLIWHR